MALLPSDPRKQKTILVAIAPIILAIAYWYLVDQSRRAEISDLSARLEQLQTKNAAAKALAAQGGPELKKKLALYEQHVARLEELIPRSEEVPDLLHDITVRAGDAGVELDLMRPDKAVATDQYTRQVYSMSVFGPFEGVGRFLTAVGSLPRIVTPRHLKVLPLITTDRRTGAQNVRAEFEIETFVAPEPGQAAAAAAAAAASPVQEKPKNAAK